MTVIRVNPESIQSFSLKASEQFAAIRQNLEAVTREVVEVRYWGPNASQFKQRCGEIAVDLSNALIRDLGSISEAVRDATSAISSALGGERVAIQFDGTPIGAPSVPAADGVVDIDTSALEALKPSIGRQFDAVSDALDRTLADLGATDWLGTAKETAVDLVGQFTASARQKVSELATNLNSTIDQQIESVRSADR
jgi:hypothetical protein